MHFSDARFFVKGGTTCPKCLEPFYIVTFYVMGQEFLDIQYGKPEKVIHRKRARWIDNKRKRGVRKREILYNIYIMTRRKIAARATS